MHYLFGFALLRFVVKVVSFLVSPDYTILLPNPHILCIDLDDRFPMTSTLTDLKNKVG